MPVGLTEQLRSLITNLRPSVKTDYLKKEIFSKFVSPDTDPPLVRRNRAIAKWLATERENAATNDRLLFTSGEYNILPRITFDQFVAHAQHLIVETIGETVPIEALLGSFSGGATTSRARTQSHPAQKYLGLAHVTERCRKELVPLIEDELPLWFQLAGDVTMTEGLPLELVDFPGNVLFTVPKKTDIDRCACKEPDVNMFLQKGIGGFIRRSLRHKGINLNDQSINKRLAREGSLTGRLATLDLSSASDSVSTELVSLLLPSCWYSVLDAARCHVTIIDGEEHRNEMFSSMGNGFTFELESLLFWTLVKTTCYFTGVPGIVSVYGDDIICPVDVYNDVVWVLGFFGFSVNTEKSFSNGPFRESCGGHFYDGFDITPFYVKAPLAKLTDVIHVANQLREWASFGPHSSVLDPEVEDIWLWLKSFVPSRFWGGVDTSFKFQLVSDDLPQARLVPRSTPVDTGFGGYLHWHNATWQRLQSYEGVQTSSSLKQVPFCRERKAVVSTVARLSQFFYHEVSECPSTSS